MEVRDPQKEGEVLDFSSGSGASSQAQSKSSSRPLVWADHTQSSPPAPAAPVTLDICQAKFSHELHGLPHSVGRGGGGEELSRFPACFLEANPQVTQVYIQN